MALEVVILSLVFAAVLFSLLKWLKDLNSKVLDLIQGMKERRQPVNSEVLVPRKGMDDERPLGNRETTSLPDELDGFYGRDGDKEAIIRSLLLSDDAHAGSLGVIPIVGMGGVGKTTLAQHVYNDKVVEGQFKVRAWVCVSDQFDATEVTRKIVKKVIGGACPGDDLDQLQCSLKEYLDGKKFLLVLDDVWSEDYNGWTKLLTPLRYGAKGSNIIITTRSKKVASKVQTVATHDLKVLEDEDCGKLFARHAWSDVNCAPNYPKLQEIGKKIVRKCGGLPLAAKALGGVLRRETTAKKWEQVLESEIWDVQNANILPALAMSYIHLPTHLKRCFAYCAIFPRNYEFEKEKLVALWMFEGFLIPQKANQSLEERGDMYFDDLVSRSFFQHSIEPWGKPYFVMHDLVHDLARFASGGFCSGLERGTSSNIGERTRHLFCKEIEEDVLKKFQGIHKTRFLRSLVLSECFNMVDIDGLSLRWKLLRVLSLSGNDIRELPNSVGNLKCMRHLDLSYTLIELLPEAVTGLFNLEILILRGCRVLVELPADMARLINLCQLDLRGTFRLEGMPPEMGKLKKLSKLTDFIVGKNGGSSIKELSHLHCLRGQISIRKLQNVEDDRDASEVILKDKENLKVLELKWKSFADYSRQAEEVLERLQPHPHIECIEILSYGGTKFPDWVGDISFSKLKKLRLKGCRNCICLPPLGQLVSLEELTIHGGHDSGFRLQSARHDDDDDYGYGDYNEVLEVIGVEFYGKCEPGEKPFSSLKSLKFTYMSNWREWNSCNAAFPFLEELELKRCPRLMSVPNHLPSLKRLRIEGCKEVNRWESTLMSDWTEGSSWNGAFPVLEQLELHYCSQLMSVPSHLQRLKLLRIVACEGVKCMSLETFPNLKQLDIHECRNLESLVGSTAAATTTTGTSDPLFCPSLISLSISGCHNLVAFPRGGLRAPKLKLLAIVECRNFKWLPQGTHCLLSSLEEMKLRDCPKLSSVPTDLPSLKRLRISRCDELDIENLLIFTCATLETIDIIGSEKVKCISVENFLNLKELEISDCNNLESLVGLTAATATTTTRTSDPLFSPSLTSLNISECSKLVSFPGGGLDAPNLKVMYLCGCRNLKSLPQAMHSLLPSLERLTIWGCPKIESLPEEGLPSSLSSMSIGGCLVKRCEREIGEDWPKIKHIPDLNIENSISDDEDSD